MVESRQSAARRADLRDAKRLERERREVSVSWLRSLGMSHHSVNRVRRGGAEGERTALSAWLLSMV